MKKIYLIMGLITAIFLLDKTTVTASQQDIMFVLDNSGSMRKNDPDIIINSLVSAFIKQLQKVDRVGVIIFDESARLAAPLTLLDNPKAREKLSGSLAQMNYRGQLTNTPAAIERAVYELRTNGRKDSQRSIVFLTDGIIDTGNARRDLETTKWLIEDLTAECADLGIKIFSVAFTEKADFHLIQSLAAKTKGTYFRTSEANDISKMFKKITELLTADTNSTTETIVEPVDMTNQATNLNTNKKKVKIKTKEADTKKIKIKKKEADIKKVKIKKKEADSIITSLLQNLSWAIIVLVAISTFILLIYLFFRQKNTPLLKPTLAEPIGQDSSLDVNYKAQLLGISKTGMNNSEPPLLYFLDQHKHKITIGRDPENVIVIPKPTISNFHASIQYVNGHFQLEDNRSTNGTFLEDSRLAPNQPVRLKHGDVVKFATFDFRFLYTNRDTVIKTTMLTSSRTKTRIKI